MKYILILITLLCFIKINGQIKITVDAKFTNIFEFVNIHDYTKKEIDTLKKSRNLNRFPENLVFKIESFETENTIKLLTNFKIIHNNETHFYIKYAILKKGKTSKIEIMDLIKDKEIWLKNVYNNSIFNPVSKILLNSNASILFEFYNKENNSSFPEINKLKPLVKDENGVLDIYKLAEIIEKNKVTLSKYLDE